MMGYMPRERGGEWLQTCHTLDPLTIQLSRAYAKGEKKNFLWTSILIAAANKEKTNRLMAKVSVGWQRRSDAKNIYFL